MDAVTIIIERFDGTKRYTQEYAVDKKALRNLTVLSTLILIKETLDPTLNFTASCRSAICGACGVRVNKRAILACDTKIEELLAIYGENRLTISPLANFTVLSDLVVDWEPSIADLRKIHPGLVAKSEFSKKKGCLQKPADFERIKLMWDCILCGCCASECNKRTSDKSDFMEPFVYTHARRRCSDSRSRDPMVHAKPALDNGLWKCVHCQQCADVCPKAIKPVDDIADMRGLTMRKGFTEGKGPQHAEAFYTDLKETGRLNEVKLELKTEGFGVITKAGLAFRMLQKGKLNPMEVLGEDKIKGHDDLARMLDAAKAAAKAKE